MTEAMTQRRPTILSTRPSPGDEALIAELERLGYRALSAPMLRIERAGELDRAALARASAVALTSAAAARLAAEDLAGAHVSTPCFCVGDATARAAREAGFSDARSAGGDARDLLALLLALTPPPASVYLPRAEHTAVDLGAALRARGVVVAETVLYRAVPESVLPPEAAQALAAGEMDAVLLFSARAAAAFLTAAGAADLSGLAAICIGERVAAALPPERFGRVLAAAAPDRAAMLLCLNETIPARH